MGLKDKMQKAWKRVSDLEDTTEDAKEKAKASGRIPYKKISKSLKELMKDNVDVVGRKIIIPNYYEIHLNEDDRKVRLEVEDVLCEELREEIYHEIRKINPEQNKRDIEIVIQTDPVIESGGYKIMHHIKRPSEQVKSPPPAAGAPQPEPDNYAATVIEQPTVIQSPESPPSADEQPTMIMPSQEEASTHYTLLIKSDDIEKQQRISKPNITIGRSTTDDVMLESPDFSISRAHATIEKRGDDLFLTPQGINGTALNGTDLELKKEVKVETNDEIKISSYSLTILP